MTKLFVAKRLNSRYKGKVTSRHKRILSLCSQYNWTTLDGALSDSFGVYCRDNYI